MNDDASVTYPSQARTSERWARFRFGVVGRLLAAPPSPGELPAQLRLLAAQSWPHPVSGRPVRFGLSTIERWYYAAREGKDPVQALARQTRSDQGTHPAICAQAAEWLALQHRAHPSWSDHSRLGLPADRQRLERTVAQRRPRLLVLDPLIRLHRIDENDASQVAPLLSFLRQLQRRYQVAVALVHHARKDAHATRPGQALRGSSELHGWGDSNLYLRRHKHALTLTTEHRAAPSAEPFALQVIHNGLALALAVLGAVPAPSAAPATTPVDRVREAMAGAEGPLPVQQLRKLCSMRTATLCASLAQLTRQGLVVREAGGYQLRLPLDPAPRAAPLPVSPPRDPQGN